MEISSLGQNHRLPFSKAQFLEAALPGLVAKTLGSRKSDQLMRQSTSYPLDLTLSSSGKAIHPT